MNERIAIRLLEDFGIKGCTYGFGVEGEYSWAASPSLSSSILRRLSLDNGAWDALELSGRWVASTDDSELVKMIRDTAERVEQKNFTRNA